ncbi:MAG: tRNA-intron lyase [Candidatus Micrarchaeota archaeon]|nr:tRNA-intron lyase [Candidatus Micrarchaeota archaeon]
MALALELKGEKVYAADHPTKDVLGKSSYGKISKGKLELLPEEALYLMDVRNAECKANRKQITFTSLAYKFSNRKLMSRYFAYKDWRDRGLILRSPALSHISPHATPIKRYPGGKIKLPGYRLKGAFFPHDLMSVLEDDAKGKYLYENYWLGQYGTYKAADRGRLNKLDAYETLFLMDKGRLTLKNATKAKVASIARKRRADFPKLYEVYRDWREHGYVIKTGFKFGTHFRVYFPGARPIKDDNWVHSKHVIHVFPKESKLLISEWARAIRVAHSVRKTFILAIPGKARAKGGEIDFILYHRRGGDTESPEKSPPKFAMLSLGEEEYIGGSELSGAIRSAQGKRLELVLAIADRETAVTYYRVKRIELPGSRHDYYEIDWMQP